jgi:FtsZ-binding cell division protein ZapB
MAISMGVMFETGYRDAYNKFRSELEALKVENTRLRSEVSDAKLATDQAKKDYEKLRADVSYWSYCTRRGMLETCPEKSNELKEFNEEIGISPA